MSRSGYVQCFLFEQAPVRGCVARLDPVWQSVVEKRPDDPQPVRRLMGELLAACALLSAHLKFEGSLSLQLMGQGALSLLVAEYRSHAGLRVTARYNGPVDEQAGWQELVGEDARFSVLIDQGTGQPWQGVVPVEAGGIAASLQAYFEQSEQLPTRFLLWAEAEHCAGFLLQKMPDAPEETADDWEALFLLAETLKPEELLRWDELELLRKLFAEHDIRLFDAQPRQHACTCSREGVAGMIRQLGQAEAEDILRERGGIEVTCEFCGQQYGFDSVDVAELFRGDPLPAPETRH